MIRFTYFSLFVLATPAYMTTECKYPLCKCPINFWYFVMLEMKMVTTTISFPFKLCYKVKITRHGAFFFSTFDENMVSVKAKVM